MTRQLVLAAVLVLVAGGCGSSGSSSCQDYGNLFNSPSGLILVEGEHPTGWSRPDCFTCHPVGDIHCTNRTGIPTLDIAQIRAVVDSLGLASCPQCHGINGVQP